MDNYLPGTGAGWTCFWSPIQYHDTSAGSLTLMMAVYSGDVHSQLWQVRLRSQENQKRDGSPSSTHPHLFAHFNYCIYVYLCQVRRTARFINHFAVWTKCEHFRHHTLVLRQIVEPEKCLQGVKKKKKKLFKCLSTKKAAQSAMHTVTGKGHAVTKCKCMEGFCCQLWWSIDDIIYRCIHF